MLAQKGGLLCCHQGRKFPQLFMNAPSMQNPMLTPESYSEPLMLAQKGGLLCCHQGRTFPQLFMSAPGMQHPMLSIRELL